MDIVKLLRERDLLQDVSNEDKIKALKPGDGFYVGFDPTAPSMQFGNLFPIISSIRLARAGLKPIMLFGGATGSIGDPSGKSEERKLISRDVLDNNLAHQMAQVEAIFKRAGVTDYELVNNHDWLKDMSFLEFLRDVGKHFPVNYMLAKETVKTRLEGDGITYTEFSYMLLQSYDFLHLYQNHNCKLQIGGSDQWGNITAGLEFVRRKLQGDADVCALASPLVTDSQGRKYGKSAGNAVWIDRDMYSPYRFHQFLLNTPDELTGLLLRFFTFLEMDEILELEKSLSEEPEKRLAQKALADNVCNIVHGEEATEEAKKSASVLFGGSMEGLGRAQLEDIFSEVPSVEIEKANLQGMSYIDLLVESGATKSKGEARRLIKNNGAYLNNERITDQDLQMSSAMAIEDVLYVIRTGKKNYYLVKIAGE